MANGPYDKPLTQAKLALELGLSITQPKALAARGMPTHDAEAARAWRDANVRPPGNGHVEMHSVQMPRARGETLEDSLDRLRRLEKGLSKALGRAFHNGQVQQATALRREYIQSLAALSVAEAKLMKLQQERLQLISVSRALKIVDDGLQAGLTALRRLPELACDGAEKARLEEFLNAVLEEFRRGAAESAAPFRTEAT
jgi:hypothetical protein